MNALKFQGVRFLFAGMVLVLLSTRLVRLGALAPAHGKIQFYLFLTALAVSLTALILIVIGGIRAWHDCGEEPIIQLHLA